MMDFEHLRSSVKDIKMPNDTKKRIIDTALQQTEEYINKPTSERRHGGFLRRSAAVLLAATLVLSMSVVAFAVVASDWFAAFFINRSGSALTSDQYQFIEEKSVGIGQSVTEDGYTVTVDSAICDAQNLYLVIHVEGPVGVKLDLDAEEGSLSFAYTKCESTGTYERTGYLISGNGSWYHLDDGDEKDNTATILMRRQRVLSAGSNQVYTDGEIWRFHFADLHTRTGDFSSVKTILAEGGWSFEFSLTTMSEDVELISSPVVCVAEAGGENGSKEPAEIMVTSLVLRPFGLTCSYSFVSENRPEAVDILDIYLVMKDGSTVVANPKSGGGTGGIGSTEGTMSYIFDAPVMPDEVAYLVLPGNVQVSFPQ